MSTKNNKSTIAQALMEMDSITSAIKEESKKSINTLLSEAVRNALRENCDESEEEEYEVVDDEKNDAVDTENETENEDGNAVEDDSMDSEDDEAEVSDEAGQEAPENGEGEEDWSEFSKYQVSDNTYDLTGENDYENVMKVYKRLKDDDNVIIRKEDNIIRLQDDSVGTEYVIDLGTDGDGASVEVNDGEEGFDSLQEEIGYRDEFDPIYHWKKKNELPIDDEGMGFEFDDEFDDEDDIAGIEDELMPHDFKPASKRELEALDFENWDTIGDEEEDKMYESKNIKNKKLNGKTRKPMKESKEVLFEVDLGYTDNYQDKDAIAGLSNNEPSKSGKSWHKGVPTGTQKPWAGNSKSKGKPFEKTVNEEEMPEMTGIDEMPVDAPMEEAAMSTSSQSMAKETKSRTSAPRRENARKVTKNMSTAENGYEATVNENKKLKAENKALKEAILAIKKNLSEAYVTNANLGKITKLFLENTTSQAEKIDIVNRFSNEAKTIEQSKALYESINRELNKPAKTKTSVNESMTVAGKENINESKVYKSNDLIKTIDFMKRMMNY